MKKIGNSKIFSILVFAYLSAVAICMTYNIPELNSVYTKTALSEMVWNLKYSLSNTAMQSTLLFGCFAYAGVFIEKRKTTKMNALPIISILLAIVWVMGKSFYIDDTLDAMFSTLGQTVKTIIYVFGVSWIINQCFYLFYWFIHNFEEKEKKIKSTKVGDFCLKHSILTTMVLLILFWLPNIIISFPGYTYIDAWTQLLQYFDVREFTSHHPPVHTIIMGAVIEFGTKLANRNLGIFLFVVIQCLCASAVISYSLYTMKKLLNAPKWLLTIGFIIGAIVPYYSGYVSLIVKDNLFSYAFLLFMIELLHYIVLGNEFFKSKKHTILFSVAVTFTLLFRNNGKYVLYPFLAFLLVYLGVQAIRQQGKKAKKEKGKFILKTAAIFLVPIIFSTAVSAIFTAKYDIEKGSRREALSFMFQQTARYVSEYERDVTKSEAEAISAILDYDNLPELYDPRISDPVKRTFNDDCTTEDLVNYLKVWAVQLFKHPTVYIEATVNQNYYLLYPVVENNKLYYQTYWGQYIESINKVEGFEDVVFEDATPLRRTNNGFIELMFSIPLMGALSSPAFYNLILIALFIFSAYKKKINWLIASIPIILSNAIIILAPVIQGHPRYAFPIVFSMPILFAYYLYTNKKGVANVGFGENKKN